MCKRKDAVKDPLASLLFRRYGLHLLGVPRAGVQIGDVYVFGRKGLVGSGRVAELFASDFSLPAINEGERAIPLEDTASSDHDLKIGLELLDRLFKALGFDQGPKIGAAYASQKATKMRFRFDNPTRDSVDILAVTDRLYGATPRQRPVSEAQERLYLVTGVLRSAGISIVASAADDTTVDVGATVSEIADASAKLKVTRNNDTSLVYAGDTPLGFGVELIEITYDSQTKRFGRQEVDSPIRVRSATGSSGSRAPSMIGDDDDDELFLEVRDA
jgi:hypothetical protein